MFRVALKGLLGHKLRFLGTTVSVVLGVSFVAGTFVLTDSMDQAFVGLFADISADTDVYVQGLDPTEGSLEGPQNPGAGPTVPDSLVGEILAVEGVAHAEGWVEGFAQFVDRDGEPIVSQAPTFGFSFTVDNTTLRSGREPSGPTEATMDIASATDHGFALGDEVQIVFATGVQKFKIVGLTGFGEEDNLLGATVAAFDLETARDLFDKEGRFDGISVQAVEGVSPEELRDRLAPFASETVEVLTSQEQSDSELENIRTALGFFNTALLAFGGVALFVGSFIIANTFSIVVAQRTREFALLRALGASAKQVQRAVQVEAVAIGVLAGTLGLLAGVGMAAALTAALSSFGLDLPQGGTVLAPRTIVVSYVIGIVVTVLASLSPARRAATVAPIEAMRGTGLAEEATSRRRIIVGSAVGGLGVVALVLGLVAGQGISWVGLGAALTLLGVALLAPLATDAVVSVLGRVPRRLSLSGRLAEQNARRSPARTASTASALMIGLALVSFVTIFAASINASIGDTFTEQFTADFIIATDQPGFRNLPPVVADSLAQSPELGEVSPIRLSQFIDANGDATLATAVNVSTIEELVFLDVTDGEIAALDVDQVFVQSDKLDELALSVGESLPMTFPDGIRIDARIAGSFTNDDLAESFIVSLQTAQRHDPTAFDFFVYANATNDLDAARAAIDNVLAQYPGSEVQDQAEFRATQEDAINQILQLMIVLLLLAAFIALLGIANTLALSVFERTREIGLLRAVGMDGPQTRRMITWESVIVAVFGALLGIAVGTFFGWAVVQALKSEGITRLVLPVAQLALYVVVAGLAGVAAALLPAWRASKLDVLAAVTTE